MREEPFSFTANNHINTLCSVTKLLTNTHRAHREQHSKPNGLWYMSLGLNAALQCNALSPYLPLLVEAGTSYHLRSRREKRVSRRRRTPTELREKLGRTTLLQIEEALKRLSGRENGKYEAKRGQGGRLSWWNEYFKDKQGVENLKGTKKKKPYLKRQNLWRWSSKQVPKPARPNLIL